MCIMKHPIPHNAFCRVCVYHGVIILVMLLGFSHVSLNDAVRLCVLAQTVLREASYRKRVRDHYTYKMEYFFLKKHAGQ